MSNRWSPELAAGTSGTDLGNSVEQTVIGIVPLH